MTTDHCLSPNRKKCCFHATGEILFTDPPQSVFVCCFCGQQKRKQLTIRCRAVPGHGPYHPRMNQREDQP